MQTQVKKTLYDSTRRALYQKRWQNSPAYRLLQDQIADRLNERLGDIKKSFNQALIIGALPPSTKTFLSQKGTKMAFSSKEGAVYDLILDIQNLHTANNPKEVLESYYNRLDKDGLFLAAMPGEENLKKLKTAFIQAESDLKKGATQRFPLALGAEDMARLLLDVGFDLPVVDVERQTVTYPSFRSLLRDIQQTGESHCLKDREHHLTAPTIFKAAEKIYLSQNPNKTEPLTFLFLHGWKK